MDGGVCEVAEMRGYGIRGFLFLALSYSMYLGDMAMDTMNSTKSLFLGKQDVKFLHGQSDGADAGSGPDVSIDVHSVVSLARNPSVMRVRQ